MLIESLLRILFFPFLLLIGLFIGTAGKQIEHIKKYFDEVKSRGFFGGLAYILLTPLADAVEFITRDSILNIDPLAQNHAAEKQEKDQVWAIALDDGSDFQYSLYSEDLSPEQTFIVYFGGSDEPCAFDHNPYAYKTQGLPPQGLNIISPVRPGYHIDENGNIKQVAHHDLRRNVERYKEFIIKFCRKNDIRPEQVVLHGFSWGGAEAIATSHALEKAGFRVRGNIVQSGVLVDMNKFIAHMATDYFIGGPHPKLLNFLFTKELKYADSEKGAKEILGNQDSPEICFIHGSEDDRATLEQAKEQYMQCVNSGRKAHFVALEGQGHDLSYSIVKELGSKFALNREVSSTNSAATIEHGNLEKEPAVLQDCKTERHKSETRELAPA
ncbi:hypothetical protein RLOatenuis_7890 [Rickettsiales bacterium]|nr:hypothetical protein RLOatenuis_7890 [Rickettsiales bacterium]